MKTSLILTIPEIAELFIDHCMRREVSPDALTLSKWVMENRRTLPSLTFQQIQELRMYLLDRVLEDIQTTHDYNMKTFRRFLKRTQEQRRAARRNARFKHLGSKNEDDNDLQNLNAQCKFFQDKIIQLEMTYIENTSKVILSFEKQMFLGDSHVF